MSRMARPTAFGSPDVLTIASTPIPDVEAGHVVVRVKAAGVNPIDWKLYSAAFRAAHRRREDTADVLTDPLPGVGLECAGVVVAVGTDAFNMKIGDEVIVHPVVGAYADYVHAPITSLTIKPPALGWPQAAALMLAGTTAAHALDAAGVQTGDTVLIHGGSGGVGLMAIQLAVDLGAAVIATAARANHNLLTQLGAQAVTYGPGLIGRLRALAPDGVDAALDLVGTDEALDTSLALVDHPRRIACIAGGSRRAEVGAKILGNAPGADKGTDVRQAARQQLVDKAAAGRLRVIIDRTYSLESAADAHRAGMQGHRPGKLVIVP